MMTYRNTEGKSRLTGFAKMLIIFLFVYPLSKAVEQKIWPSPDNSAIWNFLAPFMVFSFIVWVFQKIYSSKKKGEKINPAGVFLLIALFIFGIWLVV